MIPKTRGQQLLRFGTFVSVVAQYKRNGLKELFSTTDDEKNFISTRCNSCTCPHLPHMCGIFTPPPPPFFGPPLLGPPLLNPVGGVGVAGVAINIAVGVLGGGYGGCGGGFAVGVVGGCGGGFGPGGGYAMQMFNRETGDVVAVFDDEDVYIPTTTTSDGQHLPTLIQDLSQKGIELQETASGDVLYVDHNNIDKSFAINGVGLLSDDGEVFFEVEEY